MKSYVYLSRVISLALITCLLSLNAVAQAMLSSGHFLIENRSQSPLIICNQLPSSSLGPFTTIDLGGQMFDFFAVQTALVRGQSYSVTRRSDGKAFALWFSEVPLINIHVSGGVGSLSPDLKNEEAGTIEVTDVAGSTYSSMVGVRLRGNISIYWPKKSYRVQLRQEDTNAQGWSNKDESVLGMRSDKRWLLLSLYNERLRFNNRISHQLWMDMHKLYYLAEEPDAKSTITTKYVNVFIDDLYRGIFLFTENTDRKQLKLKKSENDGTVRGALYKGEDVGVPNQFGPIPSPTFSDKWAAWELEYPDVIDWENMFQLSNFVQHSSNQDFTASAASWLKLDNLSDYLLFANLIRAGDNWGKNLFMARYKEGEPYFYGVWDLDGTWGYTWNAFRNPTTNDLLKNDLLGRVIALNPNQFKHKTAVRWFALRNGLLSESNLLQRFDTEYNFLRDNSMYALEEILKGRLSIDPNQNEWLSYGQGELNYTKQWLRDRLVWMDAYFRGWIDSALPAMLTDFSGHQYEEGVRLSWRTVQEKAVARFVVLRSTDATNWTEIGAVEGHGDSREEISYDYQDIGRRSGTVFYRLKIVDFDGSADFSRIISVLRSGKPTRVYPNPSLDKINVVAREGQEIDRVEIVNTVGQIVKTLIGRGNKEERIGVRGLSGFYLLKVYYDGGGSDYERILVEQ